MLFEDLDGARLVLLGMGLIGGFVTLLFTVLLYRNRDRRSALRRRRERRDPNSTQGPPDGAERRSTDRRQRRSRRDKGDR